MSHPTPWQLRARWAVTLLTGFIALFAALPLHAQEEPVHLPIVRRPLPTATATATPTATAQPTSTPPPTATPTATPTARPGASPTPTSAPTPNGSTEWTQFAHDAQRTSFQPVAVEAPWRWKWAWNGPDATGGVVTGKSELPRNSQPITGGGRVYIAAGSRGVVALNAQTGAPLWERSPGGAINSTPAYHAASGALFVVASNGSLYKLDSATGATLGSVAGGAASDLPLPPALVGNTVYFVMGASLHAVDAGTLAVKWSYNAGSMVDTPPAFSAGANTLVVLSRDLQVHAVNADNGQQRWRVKPTSRTSSQAFNLNNTQADVRYGWPVIAEGHGVVFIRYRLDWNTLWTWSPWPATNAAMRANLNLNPSQQPLYALRLSDGQPAFVANVGNGGYGDGDYLPMGPLPAIRRLPDGGEVAYVVMRGSPCLTDHSCDGRWDARLGEMVLDGATVSGYDAGDVRFMQGTFVPTDEMPFLTAAGDQVLAAHWEAGLAQRIVDRAAVRGSGANPIVTANLPHIATSQDQDRCNSGFSAGHFCALALRNTREWPGGFYAYWQQGAIYDQYWSGYASWVVSGGLVLYVLTDGTVVALEAGAPAASASQAHAPAAEPAPARAAAPLEGSALPVVAVADAASYAGRMVTVQGTLAEVFNNGKAVYLTFAKPHQGAFLVRIRKQDWAAFPAAPESLYAAGQPVQVSGRMAWYQGDPVIYVSSPLQIRTVAPNVGATAASALEGTVP